MFFEIFFRTRAKQFVWHTSVANISRNATEQTFRLIKILKNGASIAQISKLRSCASPKFYYAHLRNIPRQISNNRSFPLDKKTGERFSRRFNNFQRKYFSTKIFTRIFAY